MNNKKTTVTTTNKQIDFSGSNAIAVVYCINVVIVFFFIYLYAYIYECTKRNGWPLKRIKAKLHTGAADKTDTSDKKIALI